MAFGAIAQDQGNDLGFLAGLLGLDQGQAFGRRHQVGQARAFGDPLVGDGRGPQRQRHQPVAPRHRGGRVGPAGGASQGVDQGGEAGLGMIFGLVVKTVTDRLGLVEVEARQHNRAFGQPCHGLHEQPRRAMRSGRSHDDHRTVGQVPAL